MKVNITLTFFCILVIALHCRLSLHQPISNLKIDWKAVMRFKVITIVIQQLQSQSVHQMGVSVAARREHHPGRSALLYRVVARHTV
jgi:hypothetical protein